MHGSTMVVSFIVRCLCCYVFVLFRDGEVEEAEKVYFVYVSGFVKAVFRLVSYRFTWVYSFAVNTRVFYKIIPRLTSKSKIGTSSDLCA